MDCEKRPVKLIALDLDDTLLGKDLRVSEGNQRALQSAMDAGVTVVLASGRPTAGMIAIANSLKLPARKGWIVSYNGGQIYDCSQDNVFWENSLTRQDALDILTISQREGLGFLTYDKDGILTPEANEWTGVENLLTGLEVTECPDLANTMPEAAPKVILLGDPAVITVKLPKLKAEFSHRWNIATSKPFFLEFTPFGIEKGSALQRLSEYLEIIPSEALAVGDGNNDLTMIRWAGIGVAMANAADSLKEEADWITAHHDEDGVARAVERFVL